MSTDVLFNVENHIGFITLNRTLALNALNLPMILLLQKMLKAWDEDKFIHAIVIQSASEKAFCAGGDVRWIYEAGKKQDPAQLEFFKHEYQLNHFIHHLKTPYIALMNGLTMGGGVGISLHGSHTVASDGFVFAMPETSIGFFPDIGASYLLSQCKNHAGIYLGLTGNRLNASEACALGLVKYVIPSHELDSVVAQLMNTDLSEDAHARVDNCLQRFVNPIQDLSFSHKAFVQDCFKYTEMEAIINALEQGAGEWHLNVFNTLQQKSPLSLKITLSQLLKSKALSLAECLQMDYCLVNHFMRQHDFYEGIRALLVDKDKSPQWQPNRLALVTDDMVSAYFECNQEALMLMSDEVLL